MLGAPDAFQASIPPQLVFFGPGLPLDGPRPLGVGSAPDLGAETRLGRAQDVFVDGGRLVPVRPWVEATFRAEADGRHYLVVYSAETGGRFWLQAERSGGHPFLERLLEPFDREAALRWDGYPGWLLMASWILGAAALGGWLVLPRVFARISAPGKWLIVAAAALGASGMVAATQLARLLMDGWRLQTVWPVAVELALNACVGVAAGALALSTRSASKPWRIACGGLAVVSAWFALGYLWGTVALALAAFAPSLFRRQA